MFHKSIVQPWRPGFQRLKRGFVAFDFETTGLSRERDRIIEVGATRFVEGVPKERFHAFINPGFSIPFEATAVNGITDEMVANALSEREVIEALLEFVSDDVLVAHNADFDVSFLRAATDRCGIEPEVDYVDTLNLAKCWVSGLRNYKQDTVLEYFGLHNEASHRADADAEMCGKMLVELLREMEAAQREQEGVKGTEIPGLWP